MDLIIATVFLLLILGVFLLFSFRKKSIDTQKAQVFLEKIENTRSLDPEHAILEMHKVFVVALKSIDNSKLTAAKTIARHQKRIPNIKNIWSIHRLRNQLAHEIGIKVADSDAEKARKAFQKAIRALCK